MIIELTETHFYLGVGLGVAGLALLGLIAYQLRALRGQALTISVNTNVIIDALGLMKNGIADVFAGFAQELTKKNEMEAELYDKINKALDNLGEKYEQKKEVETTHPIEA